jgi:hypothetical protein
MRNVPSQRLSLACLSRVLLGVSSFPTEYILRYLTLLSSRLACPLLCCSALSFVLSIYILSLAAISSLALLHIIITVPCGTYYHSHLSTYAAICTSASIRSFNRNRSPSAKPLSPENRSPEIAVYLIATDTYILNYHTHLEHHSHQPPHQPPPSSQLTPPTPRTPPTPTTTHTMGLLTSLRAKLEIYRLEQRYTRRDKRSTWVSGAQYVDGEYVYGNESTVSSPTSSTNSNGSRSSRASGFTGKMAGVKVAEVFSSGRGGDRRSRAW